MKKGLLFLSFLAITIGVFAQGQVVWKNLEGTDELADTVEIYRHAQHTGLVFEALISNISSNNYNVALKRTIVNYAASDNGQAISDQLCYGTDCQFGTETTFEIATNASEQLAGTDVSTIVPFEMIHYVPAENAGTTILKYYILTETSAEGIFNLEDSVVVKYIVEPYVRVSLNFEVDMADVAGFDPATEKAYVEIPALGEKIKMKLITGTTKFKKTIDVDGNLNYTYKYYAEDVAETIVRESFDVAETDMDFDDKFDFLTSLESNIFETVSIYPNPFSSNVTINNIENATSVEITNILGQTVFSTSSISNRMVLQTSDLKTGMYFIRISDDNNNVFTERVMKR